MTQREVLKKMLRAAQDGPNAIESLARRHAEAAVASLAAVLNDENATPAVRISAATALLQWGYGRPGAQIKVKPSENAVQLVRLSWGAEE
jgi:HEAT repeat protein